jgi:hypothetical protein
MSRTKKKPAFIRTGPRVVLPPLQIPVAKQVRKVTAKANNNNNNNNNKSTTKTTTRGNAVTTITVKRGRRLPTRNATKNPLPPRHSHLKITVEGKVVPNQYTTENPNKPGVITRRETRAYAILPPVEVGPIDKFTSKTKPREKSPTKANKPATRTTTQPPTATTQPPCMPAATRTTTTQPPKATTQATTQPPCMPAAPPHQKAPSKKAPTKKAKAPTKKAPTKKATSTTRTKNKPGAPSRSLKKRAIVEVYRAVEYSHALAKAAATAAQQNLKNLEEKDKKRQAELKARRTADNKLYKAIARSNADYTANENRGAKQRMRDLRARRKQLQMEGKFDPDTIVQKPNRCKPSKDSALPFVKDYQVTNLGLEIPVSNTPAFFEAIQWYRRYIATDTEEEDNSKFTQNCELLEGKIDLHHNCLLYTSPSPRDRG